MTSDTRTGCDGSYDGAVSETRPALVSALEDARKAGRRLVEAIEHMDSVTDRAITELEAGSTATAAYAKSDFNPARDDVFAAFDAFEQAFNKVRALGVRMAVDDEGASFTEVGRLVGRSRQFVTRLYRQAGD